MATVPSLSTSNRQVCMLNRISILLTRRMNKTILHLMFSICLTSLKLLTGLLFWKYILQGRRLPKYDLILFFPPEKQDLKFVLVPSRKGSTKQNQNITAVKKKKRCCIVSESRSVSCDKDI